MRDICLIKIQSKLSFFKGYRSNTITNSILLNSDSKSIWAEITNVMVANFRFPILLRLIGIPKPLSAEVVIEGVGGYRLATFSNNAQFQQEILEWNPNKNYRFRFNPTSNFTVAYFMNLSTGPFQIRTGGYELVKHNNSINLILSSNYELKGTIGYIMHLPFRIVVYIFQKYLLTGIKNNLEVKK